MEWGLEGLSQTGYKQSIFCKFKGKYFVVLIVLLFFEFSAQANASCMLWQPDPTTGKMDANGFLVSNFVLMEDPTRWHPTGSPAWNAANALVQASFMMPDSSVDTPTYKSSYTYTKISSGPASISEGYYGYPSIAASVTVNILYEYVDKINPLNNSTFTRVETYSGGPKWTIVPCTQNKLNIVLSGGTTTMPWHKKIDTNHDFAEANLPYKAIVTDQNGQPQKNVGLTITIVAASGTGGHAHDNVRPKGKLVITTQGKVSTKGGKETLTGTTDGEGAFSFTFGSEEASGTHTLTATCDPNPGCTAPATATVEVAIPDLMELGADPKNFTLNGSTIPHPNSHYFSATALFKIADFATVYADKKNFGEPLIINDSSLGKGGVLDLGQDWTYKPNGHQGHRKGVVVDVNNYRTKRSPQFETLALKNGIKANWEGPEVTAHPHYHLLILGPGRDE